MGRGLVLGIDTGEIVADLARNAQILPGAANGRSLWSAVTEAINTGNRLSEVHWRCLQSVVRIRVQTCVREQ